MPVGVVYGIAFGLMKLRRRSASGAIAELARRDIDQPLDHVGGFRPAGAAIGVDRHGVGVDAAQAHVTGGNVVDARQHAGADHRE